MLTRLYVSLLSVLWMTMLSCATTNSVNAPAPKSFAINEDTEKDTLVSAVSFSGVIYRVRELENKEKADLNFWRESLEFQLKTAGYIFKGKRKITVKGGQGVMMNFIAPLTTTDYNFSVALFVKSDKIYVAEAAGEVKAFKPLRADIAKAVNDISLN